VFGSRCRLEFSEVDASPEPLSGIGQQDRERRSLGVFEFYPDGIAAPGQADVGNNRCRPQLISSFGERDPARCDHVDRGGTVVVGVGPGGDHLRLTVRSNHDGIGEELTVPIQLLLSEAECSVEERVKVLLSLR